VTLNAALTLKDSVLQVIASSVDLELGLTIHAELLRIPAS
jgi:hypothetical protein